MAFWVLGAAGDMLLTDQYLARVNPCSCLLGVKAREVSLNEVRNH